MSSESKVENLQKLLGGGGGGGLGGRGLKLLAKIVLEPPTTSCYSFMIVLFDNLFFSCDI